MSQNADSPWLHRFALFTALCTLALIGVGGLVTSHGVGMSVPDWPNSYGYNMFLFPPSKWIGGILYEHSHRLVASYVGMLTSVLTLWLWGKKSRHFMRWVGLILLFAGIASELKFPLRWAEGLMTAVIGLVCFGASLVWPKREQSSPELRRLGVVAFFAVVIQGVLGGLRVVLIKDEIGIFHALLAQLFFLLICAIALFTSSKWEETKTQFALPSSAGKLKWYFLGATALILAQLMLGATMRHQHAGLAVPDFPLAYGKIWPAIDPASVMAYNQGRMELQGENSITAFQIVVHMLHRSLAVLILLAVSFAAWRAHRTANKKFAQFSLFWLTLIVAQAFLGAATIWSNKAADIATLHVINGALSLCAGGLMTIWAFQPATSQQASTVSTVHLSTDSNPPGTPAAAGAA